MAETTTQQLDENPELFAPKGEDAVLLFGAKHISSDSGTLCSNSAEEYSTASPSEEEKGKEGHEQQRLLSVSNYNATKDPYAEIINGAVEVRRRVHRANEVTARLRDISRGMARRVHRQHNKHEYNAIQVKDDEEEEEKEEISRGSEKSLREKLYLEFEEEFNAALEALRTMQFFGVLSDMERMSIAVTRAAFITSRRNLIRIQENQHTHLTRLLFTAWRQQFQLRQDIIRRGGMSASIDCDGPPRRGGARESEMGRKEDVARPAFVFPLAQSVRGFGAGSEAGDDEERDDMAALYCLHKTLQRIAAMQKERLRYLVEETATAVADNVLGDLNRNKEKRRGHGKVLGVGCCSVM
ncbi:hypothetical protein LSM04_001257 [Trypanosoma melophagium]|uniref:uncharacterized protein n=1 Tax=Trypanosoma melophagium TaxID=715481 RepID=UPI00351A0996|nr:hypothetical protein LSM04_001257 [Trypanosoma melophagium]